MKFRNYFSETEQLLRTTYPAECYYMYMYYVHILSRKHIFKIKYIALVQKSVCKQFKL